MRWVVETTKSSMGETNMDKESGKSPRRWGQAIIVSSRRSTLTKILNRRYEGNFVALMSSLVDYEASTFDETSSSK